MNPSGTNDEQLTGGKHRGPSDENETQRSWKLKEGKSPPKKTKKVNKNLVTNCAFTHASPASKGVVLQHPLHSYFP